MSPSDITDVGRPSSRPEVGFVKNAVIDVDEPLTNAVFDVV